MRKVGPIAATVILFICCSLASCASEGRTPRASGTGAADSQAATGAAESTAIGLVEERTVARGTLSEYAYFVIVCDDGREWILFNEKDYSAGFGAWAGTRAVVRCVPSKGKLGFRKTMAEGLKVLSIEKAAEAE